MQDYSSGNMGSCDCEESSLSSILTLQDQREMFRSVFPGRSSDNSQEYDEDDEGILFESSRVRSQGHNWIFFHKLLKLLVKLQLGKNFTRILCILSFLNTNRST